MVLTTLATLMIFTNIYNSEGHRGTLATRDASEDGITTDYVYLLE